MNDTVSHSALLAQADFIPAPRVPRELIAGQFTDRPVSYAAVYRAILSGAIPAEQTVSNRWSVRRTDLPQVAAVLGLRPVPVQAAA